MSPDFFLSHDAASTNKARISRKGRFTVLEATINGASVEVFIWRDSSSPNGIGIMVNKGQEHIKEILLYREGSLPSVVEDSFLSPGQVEAMLLLTGEKDKLH